MYKHKRLSLAVATALSMGASVAAADIEISGYVKNETAFLLDNNQFIGEARSMTDTSSHHGDTLKFENSARAFINGTLGETASWHLDLNLIYDSEGVEDEYKGHESYTQNDWLREAYVDAELGSTFVRIGKQQVVWGTADGIKLLDIINPTDFREFNQNTMEDSRIPIWMINADIPVGETGSFQMILAEHEENKIPGLDADGDDGHPFTMMGVDSITGEVNGFMNIAPALANVANSFTLAAAGGLFDTNGDGTGDGTGFGAGGGLVGFSGFTVDGFAGNTQTVNDADLSLATTGTFSGDESINTAGLGAIPLDGAFMLDTIAQTPSAVGLPASNGNNNVTNLVSAVYDPANADSAFEYMPAATFATFNTFSGHGGFAATGATNSTITNYVRDYPDDDDGNFGFRWKQSMDNGLNYSLNYFYHYDSNPTVDISWHDATTGEELSTVLATSGDFDADTNPDMADPTGVAGGTTLTRDQFLATGTTPAINAFGLQTDAVTVLLRNSNNQYYGAFAPNPTLAQSNNSTELRFTESLNRIHSFGSSFDYALDSFDTPIVLRGEFLYNQDEMHPVVDLRLMSIGDLEGALTAEEHDVFKYVLGVDVTVMTNLLISTQFIQFRNLDYRSDSRTCTTATGDVYDCSMYTGDAPTLHLTNGLQAAEENKEFVSLFFSKPFGAEQQGRWNNITIFEDVGGYWNRFDVEYGFTDEIIGTAELNTYWGDQDSWFGQMEETSNIQVGVKYIFN